MATDINPAVGMRQDSMISAQHINPFVCIIPDREKWEGDYLNQFSPGSLVWFTDGSRTDKGTGAGFIV